MSESPLQILSDDVYFFMMDLPVEKKLSVTAMAGQIADKIKTYTHEHNTQMQTSDDAVVEEVFTATLEAYQERVGKMDTEEKEYFKEVVDAIAKEAAKQTTELEAQREGKRTELRTRTSLIDETMAAVDNESNQLTETINELSTNIAMLDRVVKISNQVSAKFGLAIGQAADIRTAQTIVTVSATADNKPSLDERLAELMMKSIPAQTVGFMAHDIIIDEQPQLLTYNCTVLLGLIQSLTTDKAAQQQILQGLADAAERAEEPNPQHQNTIQAALDTHAHKNAGTSAEMLKAEEAATHPTS